MSAEPKTPFSVAVCRLMIRLAANIVPSDRRASWREEWSSENWHRWQFLLHAGSWTLRERLSLLRNVAGAFADALRELLSSEGFQKTVRERGGSPWMCLGVLLALIAFVAVLSGGLPATRQLFSPMAAGRGELLVISHHPTVGGSDRGLPNDVVPAWQTHTKLLESLAGFNITRQKFSTPHSASTDLLVIRTEPALFQVMRVQPELGTISNTSGIVLDHQTWQSRFSGNRNAIGSTAFIGKERFPVVAVLPAGAHFLSRQPSVFIVNPAIFERTAWVMARTKPGSDIRKIDRELTKIAEDSCYYFFNSQLRIDSLDSALFTPLQFFMLALAAAILLLLAVYRPRQKQLRLALTAGNRQATLRRAGFFAAKTFLASAVVFVAGLEFSRPVSSLMIPSRDAAGGPFLLWLYILGTLGVLFWALADQRGRCRICLRLMCFPVRIGIPGCMLLDWSGTELLCSQGHGVLHVPHLAASWEEESDRWISLDDSWRDLFVHSGEDPH